MPFGMRSPTNFGQRDEDSEVPPRFRKYIKEEDIPRLPKGIRVYRGARGALFVDVRELQRLKQVYPKQPKSTPEKKPRYKVKAKPPSRPKNLKTAVRDYNEYNKLFRRVVNEQVPNLDVDIILDEEDMKNEKDKSEKEKYKAWYEEGKIRLNVKIMSPEEKVPFTKTFEYVKMKDWERAMHTLGWYYYHMVAHKLLREKGFDVELLRNLEKYIPKYALNRYEQIDVEEFFCDMFALFVYSGGDISYYLGNDINQDIKRLIHSIYSSPVEIKGGYVYDSFDEVMGVKKTTLKLD